MSFHKCFYCERKLKSVPKEIDHFIEVAERKDLAYDWDNMYLACDNCNNKSPNSSIPVTEALDPCRNSDGDIREHLTFEDEIIRAKNDSELGWRTIQKYKFDTNQIDLVRLRALQRFWKLLDQIRVNTITENRSMSEREKEMLSSFKQRDQSFSLMFDILITNRQIV